MDSHTSRMSLVAFGFSLFPYFDVAWALPAGFDALRTYWPSLVTLLQVSESLGTAG